MSEPVEGPLELETETSALPETLERLAPTTSWDLVHANASFPRSDRAPRGIQRPLV